MRIATYNIWNEDSNFEIRAPQLIDEIQKVNADIIGLQEVPPRFYTDCLLHQTGYPYHSFGQYSDEEEGLAILSKYPIWDSRFLHEYEANRHSNAISVLLNVDGRHVSFTNVPLPWDSALQKEYQICAIDRFLHGEMNRAGLLILAGDFNGGLGSSVHRYLVGDQSLNGDEANPYWDELATAYCALTGEPIKATLDVINNPRWKGHRSVYPPTVMDRLYVMEHKYDISLESHWIFGTEVSPETQLSASDHYGVAAEIVFD